MGTNEATLIYGYFSKIILGSTLLSSFVKVFCKKTNEAISSLR